MVSPAYQFVTGKMTAQLLGQKVWQHASALLSLTFFFFLNCFMPFNQSPKCYFSSVVFNLWVVTSLGLNDPFMKSYLKYPADRIFAL